MGNQGNQGQRNQHGNQQTPTGTSGRQSGDIDRGGNTDPRGNDQGSMGGRSRVNRDDDEESGLGNRTTNR